MEGAAGEGAGRPAVAQRRLAVDDHVAHAHRQLVRVLVGGERVDGVGVEHNHVGEEALIEAAAVVELERLRREGRQAPDGLGHRHQLLVAHVMAEQAGERPVGARVGG